MPRYFCAPPSAAPEASSLNRGQVASLAAILGIFNQVNQNNPAQALSEILVWVSQASMQRQSLYLAAYQAVTATGMEMSTSTSSELQEWLTLYQGLTKLIPAQFQSLGWDLNLRLNPGIEVAELLTAARGNPEIKSRLRATLAGVTLAQTPVDYYSQRVAAVATEAVEEVSDFTIHEEVLAENMLRFQRFTVFQRFKVIEEFNKHQPEGEKLNEYEEKPIQIATIREWIGNDKARLTKFIRWVTENESERKKTTGSSQAEDPEIIEERQQKTRYEKSLTTALETYHHISREKQDAIILNLNNELAKNPDQSIPEEGISFDSSLKTQMAYIRIWANTDLEKRVPLFCEWVSGDKKQPSANQLIIENPTGESWQQYRNRALSRLKDLPLADLERLVEILEARSYAPQTKVPIDVALCILEIVKQSPNPKQALQKAMRNAGLTPIE